MDYFALLLYRYADQRDERRQLEPFSWQLGRNATVEEIRDWLSSDSFPEPQNSGAVLRALSRDEIGTDDKDLIAKDIAPPLRRALRIEIRWKGGKEPGDSVPVRPRSAVRGEQQVMLVRR